VTSTSRNRYGTTISTESSTKTTIDGYCTTCVTTTKWDTTTNRNGTTVAATYCITSRD